MADIEAVIAASAKPASIEYAPGGQNKEMGESFDSMVFMLVLAIFLVYLVMAATFENLVHPILILATIPLAGVGVVLGLYLGGFAISVIALIGVVLLVGIVVNNAIVLVDAINRHRRQGMVLLVAIRPILMTTLTTVLGLLPMAFGLGEGSELRQPLAITVSCGLVLSTLLTLVVIPALYLVVPTRIRTEAEERALEEDIAAAHALETAQFEDAREVPS
jgi:hydrophobic/amphiphilic exporter-1 (mainly G- bacteria), HAE1 family